MKRLKDLGLVQGRGALPKHLLACCHEERLVGGLSISLGAMPDEVFGALTHAIGGPAPKLKVLDVRTTRPMVMEVEWEGLKEKWELERVENLVHNLNDLFRDAADARVLVVLGEWEDMLQLWAVPRSALPKLLAARLLDDAWNAAALWRLVEGA